MKTELFNPLSGRADKWFDGTVTGLPPGIGHLREYDLNTANPATFDFSDTPLKAAVIWAMNDGTTSEEFSYITYCIDPPSDAVRNLWLTQGDHLTTDSHRFPLRADGRPSGPLIFVNDNGQGAPITKIGVKNDVGTAAEIRVFVYGVEA